MTLRVRVVRPFGPFEIETPSALFSTAIPSENADALLCEWAPDEEMLAFEGPSAWYTAEPRTNRRIGVLAHREQRGFLTRLRPEQLLHHAHDDPRFRVPHMTHETPEPYVYDGPRDSGAATVVSNYGGPLHNRGPDIRIRNRYATAPGVALYGRLDKWKHYRARSWSIPRLPPTFAGGIDPGRKLEVLARYHTAICLENTCEPWVLLGEAGGRRARGLRSGVPCASDGPRRRPERRNSGSTRPTSTSIRSGRSPTPQRWIGTRSRRRNFAWLASDGVKATSRESVWERIAQALRAQEET